MINVIVTVPVVKSTLTGMGEHHTSGNDAGFSIIIIQLLSVVQCDVLQST